MTINNEGYLSPDITAWIGKHRADNADWFALAGDLNRIAQSQLGRLRARDDEHQSLVVALCFLRGLSQFQGSIIMAERGMIAEARTLIRGCLETVFLMGAANAEPDIGELLIQDDAHRRDKIAKKILSNHEILTEEDRVLENNTHRVCREARELGSQRSGACDSGSSKDRRPGGGIRHLLLGAIERFGAPLPHLAEASFVV